ncbi:MAG: Mur ligase domain-containing protein [Flavobacteriaceae bacterium]|nr:Mur ligase domain-containing protein [Flavobacteriaceae bacterium]
MNIHFISIGGSAMHNLALALHVKGDAVTGSDDAIFEPSKSRLAAKGLLPKEIGWFENKITSDIDIIILGMHAKADNPELLKAQELGIKIFSYPEYLYEHSKNKTRVVIGGSHGKTTITSMILHVLNYHNIEVDYMVGAQLDGFDRMVHLTQENEFMIIEGDEYLSSPIDRRPKFHLYKANIALLSGIAWDHINVFPTFKNYVKQFEIFIETMVNGGALIYNTEDSVVKEIVEDTSKIIKKYPYQTPEYTIDNGTTIIDTTEGKIPLEIFGKHNLQNLEGAKNTCLHIGVGEDEFYEAISSFKGANKRLEKIVENKSTVVFKDFAHSPSKVKAASDAVKEQYSNRRVLTCLELHTYSSLNADFLKEYQNALDSADEAVVFYSPDAVKIKRLEKVTKEQIAKAFQRDDLIIYTDPKEFKDFLFGQNLENTALLLMSSGNYGGISFDEIAELVDEN